MDEQMLERLETQIAFLERAHAELGEVVYRQRRELDELRARLTELARRIGSEEQPAEVAGAALERPPHY